MGLIYSEYKKNELANIIRDGETDPQVLDRFVTENFPSQKDRKAFFVENELFFQDIKDFSDKADIEDIFKELFSFIKSGIVALRISPEDADYIKHLIGSTKQCYFTSQGEMFFLPLYEIDGVRLTSEELNKQKDFAVRYTYVCGEHEECEYDDGRPVKSTVPDFDEDYDVACFSDLEYYMCGPCGKQIIRVSEDSLVEQER